MRTPTYLLSTLLLMIRRSDMVMQRMMVPKTPDPVSLLVMIVVGSSRVNGLPNKPGISLSPIGAGTHGVVSTGGIASGDSWQTAGHGWSGSGWAWSNGHGHGDGNQWEEAKGMDRVLHRIGISR